MTVRPNRRPADAALCSWTSPTTARRGRSTTSSCSGPTSWSPRSLEAGATSREVYLPGGLGWTNAWSGETYDGGEAIQQDAPLHEIPVYLRDGATVPVAGA